MSQNALILKYLQRRTLTHYMAQQLFGCMRLAARIQDLRKAGHYIITETIHANGKHFARYKLIK